MSSLDEPRAQTVHGHYVVQCFKTVAGQLQARPPQAYESETLARQSFARLITSCDGVVAAYVMLDLETGMSRSSQIAKFGKVPENWSVPGALCA